MDKRYEEEIVRCIYKALPASALQTCESPDFVCTDSGGSTLGIEVTEYYYNGTDARMHNIPGYAHELLSTRRYRHRDDKKIRIEPIVYHAKGKPEGREIMAIISDLPPTAAHLDRFAELLNEKITKREEYSKKAEQVDLVVFDPRRSFRFEKVEDFLISFRQHPARRIIAESGFREVFLIASYADMGSQCIPLRANAFLEEVFVCLRVAQEALKASVGTESARKPMDVLKAIVFGMSTAGFNDVRLISDSLGFRFFGASVELRVGRSKKPEIIDRTCELQRLTNGESVSELVASFSDVERAAAGISLSGRSEYWSAVPVYFAVPNPRYAPKRKTAFATVNEKSSDEPRGNKLE